MERYVAQLFDKESLTKFVPSESYTEPQNTFAYTRFIIYASVILFLITMNVMYLLFGAGLVAIVFLMKPSKYVSQYQSNPYGNSQNANLAPSTQEQTQTWNELYPFINQREANMRFMHVPNNNVDYKGFLTSSFPSLSDKTTQCRDPNGNCDPNSRVDRLQQRH